MGLYPAAIALCALVSGFLAIRMPGTAIISAAAAGSLFVLRMPILALSSATALAAGLLTLSISGLSVGCWMGMLCLFTAGLLPHRYGPVFLQAPCWAWPVAMIGGTAGLSAGLLLDGPIGSVGAVVACLCAMFIGAGMTRHLAVADARLLAWGDGGMVQVTRALLLGRITSGMLHDLAQPLNVISMANANMDYIISHLKIDEDSREQLQERTKRISAHTEGAAGILSLFRWFGRDGREGRGELSVRTALDRAVSATRSNVRHHGVSVHLRGNALDHLVPAQHGALEMMAVAVLLSAFGSFLGSDGEKLRGDVLLHAGLTPTHVVITVECTDAEGRPIPAHRIDEATLWLVEQMAREAAGELRCVACNRKPMRFVIRLRRYDV